MGPRSVRTSARPFHSTSIKKTTSPDVGGTFGLEGGYRFNLTDDFALSLIGNPQFFLYTSENHCCNGRETNDDVASVFAITAGPRFSLLTAGVESYVGIAGGYYRDMGGLLQDDGAGFNAGGGLAFEVAPNTTLGAFGRYDYANMVARPGSDVARQWTSGGAPCSTSSRPRRRRPRHPRRRRLRNAASCCGA